MFLDQVVAFAVRNVFSILALMLMAAAAIKVVVPLASVLLVGIAAGRAVEPFQRRAVQRAMLAEGLCPECGYDLLSTDPEEGGPVVCPECGSQWKLPAPKTGEAGKPAAAPAGTLAAV